MNQLPNLGTGKKPSKKLFAILATAFLAVLGVVGYISLAGDAQDAPPYLGIDSSSLMQGKLSKRDGFATLKTSASYSCEAENEVLLAGNVNNVFSTKPVTFEEIANSLKFDEKDGQYLIAFFSPGDDKAGKGFDAEGWYFYPTSNAPYTTGDYKKFNIKADKGANYTIPSLRGFHLIVNNEKTKLCTSALQLSTKGSVAELLGFANSKDNGPFFKNYLGYWPQGWVMVPLASDADLMRGIIAIRDGHNDASALGIEFQYVWKQVDRNIFVKDFDTNNSTGGYNMVWIKTGKPVDWVAHTNKMENAHCYADIPTPEKKYTLRQSYVDPKNRAFKYVCVLDMSSETGGRWDRQNNEGVDVTPPKLAEDANNNNPRLNLNQKTLTFFFDEDIQFQADVDEEVVSSLKIDAEYKNIVVFTFDTQLDFTNSFTQPFNFDELIEDLSGNKYEGVYEYQYEVAPTKPFEIIGAEVVKDAQEYGGEKIKISFSRPVDGSGLNEKMTLEAAGNGITMMDFGWYLHELGLLDEYCPTPPGLPVGSFINPDDRNVYYIELDPVDHSVAYVTLYQSCLTFPFPAGHYKIFTNGVLDVNGNPIEDGNNKTFQFTISAEETSFDCTTVDGKEYEAGYLCGPYGNANVLQATCLADGTWRELDPETNTIKIINSPLDATCSLFEPDASEDEVIEPVNPPVVDTEGPKLVGAPVYNDQTKVITFTFDENIKLQERLAADHYYGDLFIINGPTFSYKFTVYDMKDMNGFDFLFNLWVEDLYGNKTNQQENYRFFPH